MAIGEVFEFHPAGVVLCGGQSRRMGQAKLGLPIDGETLLEHTIRTLAPVASPIIVVASPGQELPLTARGSLEIVCDIKPHQGPLAGLAAAYGALTGRCQIVFVCACDLPLLRSAFVARMCELVGEFEAAVPTHADRRHPLAAAYRVSALAKAAELLAAGEHRAMAWLDVLNVRLVTADLLSDVDPELASLQNVNTPQDYAALIRGG
jgi:molybdopterin-guanine dinucleotide biosynthesis protein A